MKNIFLTLLLGIFFVSMVSANPISSFWIEKGLPVDVSNRIASGTQTPGDELMAMNLQNPKEISEPGLNITELNEQIAVEAEKNADVRGIFLLMLLGLMAFISVFVCFALLVREKA